MKLKFVCIFLLLLLLIIGVEVVRPDVVSHNAGGISLKRVEVLKGDNLEQILSGDASWYVIRYEHNLRGKKVIIGANSVLEFQGGCFTNGIIIGSNTEIIAPLYGIFDTDIRFEGTFKNKTLYAEWFGAVGDDERCADLNTKAINAACAAAVGTDGKTQNERLQSINSVSLLQKNYYISGAIHVPAVYFKFGGETDEPMGYVNYRMPTLITTSSDAVVKLSSRSLEPTYDKSVDHLIIKNLRVVGAGNHQTSYGIGMDECNYVNDTEFNNVYVNSCRYGVWLNMTYDSYLKGFNCTKLSCRSNVIGMFIETPESNGRNSVWMNCNKFKNCYFNNNTIFGAIIGKMYQESACNVFEDCIIEYNGSEYDIEDYNKYGAGGLKFVFGNYSFVNCYWEGNYARRKNNGHINRGESVYESCYGNKKMSVIEPTKLGDAEGNIVLMGNSNVTLFELDRCVNTSSHRLICVVNGGPMVKLSGGHYTNGYSINNKTSKNVIDYTSKVRGISVEVKDITLGNVRNFTNSIYGYNSSSNDLKLESCIDIEVHDYSPIRGNMDFEEYVRRGEYKEGARFYFDPVNGNDNNTGTNPNYPLKTIESLSRENITLPYNINIVTMGNKNMLYQIDTAIKNKHNFVFSTYMNNNNEKSK